MVVFRVQSYLLLVIQKFHCFYSRCTCVAWVPEREGTFVVGHADGNIYVYEKVNYRFLNCYLSSTIFEMKIKHVLPFCLEQGCHC